MHSEEDRVTTRSIIMGVKIEDFTGSIRNTTKQRASIFLRLSCDNVVQVASPVTPKDKGNLRQDILRRVLGLHGEIEWRKKYASYQERGMRADGSRRVRRYTTPGTGAHFAENAIKKTVSGATAIMKLANLI